MWCKDYRCNFLSALALKIHTNTHTEYQDELMRHSSLLLPLHMSTWHSCHLSLILACSLAFLSCSTGMILILDLYGQTHYEKPAASFDCNYVRVNLSNLIFLSIRYLSSQKVISHFHIEVYYVFLGIKHFQHVSGSYSQHEKRERVKEIASLKISCFHCSTESRESCLFYRAHNLSFMCVCLLKETESWEEGWWGKKRVVRYKTPKQKNLKMRSKYVNCCDEMLCFF